MKTHQRVADPPPQVGGMRHRNPSSPIARMP
jgi:hypothetical protein